MTSESGKAQDATCRAQGAQGAKKSRAKGKAAKGKKKATQAKTARQGKTSGLNAAAKVLAEAGEPLSCKQIVERAFEKGYWQSEGRTPAATIYAALLREIQNRGDRARFRKAARGKFILAK